METYGAILLRTVFLYILILLIFRVMGKREIGELSLLDLVVFMMIAELAVIAIEDTKDPVLHTVVPMLILMTIQFGLALLSLKSKKVRQLIDGKPTIIINKGKIDEKAMKSERYNFDDLMMQLREKDVASPAEVEFAILEPSGKLSVIKKQNEQEQSDIQLPLIIDGSVQEENLQVIGRNDFWLRQHLKKLGYSNLKKISFCSYDNGVFYIDLIDD